jgi:hypothetical protein
MHPAIGTLSNGRFYAYLHGYDNEPTFRKNAEALEALLLGKPDRIPEPVTDQSTQERGRAAVKTVSEQFKTYNVTLFLQHPAWDQLCGMRYPDIVAKSKSAANAIARKMAGADGHLCGGQGRAVFKAEEKE